MNDFFIFGLPRSRTAWLANLFFTDRVFCFHELLQIYTPEDLKTLFSGMRDGFGAEYVGVAEPAPMKSLGLRQIFPECPIVLIERDKKDVLKSLVLAFPKLNMPGTVDGYKRYIDINIEAADRLKKMNNVKVVKYDDLAEDAVVRDIWSHCCPGVPYNVVRGSMLQGFNVTVGYKDITSLFSHITKQRENVKKFLQ